MGNAGLLSLLIPFSLLAQTNTIRVEFEDGSRATTVGIFKRQGVVYASLADLANALSLTTFESPTTRKFELKGSSYKLVSSAGNPFITIISPAGRRSVYQLPTGVVNAAGAYFVPLASFTPLFRIALGRPAAYDAEMNVLRFSSVGSARGFDFTTLKMESRSNGMLIRIPSSRQLSDFESWLKNDGWLYVTIADAKADVDALNKLKPVGFIKKIVAIQSPTSVQLTFKLSSKIAASEIIRDENSNDILISLRTSGSEDKLLLERKQREIQSDLESQRKRWELDVIVLDAGHGGVDFGAIGVTKVREKDITLAVTLELGRL
ncbi:MAG: N-acetylmuramoyl-L-alanine amidase, partial [Bacteroidota bacterium]